MKKLSQITESIWSDMQDRGNGDIVKSEDGKKVHTCLGTDIVLLNPGCDYNGLMKSFFSQQFRFIAEITKLQYLGLSNETLELIKNDEYPYIHILKDVKTYGNRLQVVIKFWAYEDIVDFELDNDFTDEYWEKDYATICNCVADKINEISKYLTYIKSKPIILGQKGKCNDIYGGYYGLQLVDSDIVADWALKHNGEDYNKFFREELLKQFPELDNEDVILIKSNYVNDHLDEFIIPLYTYQDPINNILNIDKYHEFTTNWFKK